MAKSKSYDDQRGALAQMLKENTTPTPIQEVRPVVTKVAEEQVRLTGVWVSPDLARRLKVHAANTDMTQREIVIEALEKFFA